MVLNEIKGVHYLAPEVSNFSDMIPNHLLNFPFHYSSSRNRFLPSSPPCFTTTTPTCSTTSDDADNEYQLTLIHQRKLRRMISNRESARRSRMRKQKHMAELLSQVVRLKTEKDKLVEKLNHVSESYDKVVQENNRLKEEASDLRQLIEDLRIGSSLTSIFRYFDEDPSLQHITTQS